MLHGILAALIFITLLSFGIDFCKSYDQAKDAGYIQTDYEEERDDEGDE